MIFTPFLISHRRPDASGVIVDDLELYVVYEDDDTQWTTVATAGDAETLVAYPGSALIGDLYYQFGGQTSSAVSAQFLSVNTKSGVRNAISATGPGARIKPAVTALGSLLYLYGGSSNTAGTGYLGDFWKYDGSSWTQLDSSGIPALFGAKLITIGTHLYLLGGTSSSGPNTSIWRFAGGTWLQVPITSAALGSAFAACQHNDSIVCASSVGVFEFNTLSLEWNAIAWATLTYPQDGHIWSLDEYRVAYLGGGSGTSIEKGAAHVLDFSAEETYDLTNSNPSKLGYVGCGSCSSQGVLCINTQGTFATYSQLFSLRSAGFTVAYIQ